MDSFWCVKHIPSGCQLASPRPGANVGETREMSVPNPSARDPEQLEQYRFLGRLMAGCITINEPLNLAHAPSVSLYVNSAGAERL